MSIRLWRAGLSGLAIALVPFSESRRPRNRRQPLFSGNARYRRSRRQRRTGASDRRQFQDRRRSVGSAARFSGEFSKRITEAFAVSFGSTYSLLSPPGGPTGMGANGFQNLETTFKYRVFKNPEHEFVMSVGLSVEWGGTGARSVGADPFNTYTPTIYFGKGLRRSSGHAVLDSAGRDHRPGRLCDPGQELRPRRSGSIPTPAIQRPTPNSIRGF